jgi:hypothetical protein
MSHPSQTKGAAFDVVIARIGDAVGALAAVLYGAAIHYVSRDRKAIPMYVIAQCEGRSALVVNADYVASALSLLHKSAGAVTVHARDAACLRDYQTAPGSCMAFAGAALDAATLAAHPWALPLTQDGPAMGEFCRGAALLNLVSEESGYPDYLPLFGLLMAGGSRLSANNIRAAGRTSSSGLVRTRSPPLTPPRTPPTCEGVGGRDGESAGETIAATQVLGDDDTGDDKGEPGTMQLA